MAATPAWHAFSTESFQEKGKNASLASTEPCTALYSCQQLMGHSHISPLPNQLAEVASAAVGEKKC